MIASLRANWFSFLFLFIMALLFSPLASAASSDPIGQMVWVNGSVQAIGADNTQRSLQRRSAIFEQDTIVTGSNGSGQIVFTDNSMVSLRSGTTFRIDQYKFSGSGSGSNKYISSLAKGGFRTITGLISHANPDNYQVNTPVATIGVRGTDYSLYYGARGLLVKLDRGAIYVTNHAGRLEMNEAKFRIYAQISDLNLPPVLLTSEPPEFRGQPGIRYYSWSSLPPPIGFGPTNGGGKGGGSAGGESGGSVCVTP